MVVRHVWETQFAPEQQHKLEAVGVIHDAWFTQRGYSKELPDEKS